MNFSTYSIEELIALLKAMQENPLGGVIALCLLLAGCALAYVVLWRP